MPLTRRSVLFGSMAIASGLSTTSCGLVDGLSNKAGALSIAEIPGALRNLANEVGRETFQSVNLIPGASSYWYPHAALLMPDGGVQHFDYSGGWRKGSYAAKSLLTSPASARIADLPLGRLQRYLQAVKAQDRYLSIDVDYAGEIRVTASTGSDEFGLKPDGTGTVPEFDPNEVSGVKAAVAEMAATYGKQAERVGSFNGFVHIDGNVADCPAALRIVRRPRLAAQASIAQGTLFSADQLFDPTSFDPTTAITRKATISREAGVEGTVWDWEYRRPAQGGEPLVSYGIGPSGPDTRVWLDKNGKIAAVVAGECPKNSGWCPN